MISAYLISKWIVYIEGGSAASKDLFIRVRKKKHNASSNLFVCLKETSIGRCGGAHL